MLTKLTEPYDRRIALAAMAAVVSTMEPNNGITEGKGDGPSVASKPLSLSSTEKLLPPNGRWFKSVCSPAGAFCLYLRIAHKGLFFT